jgi:hypothetical protein
VSTKYVLQCPACRKKHYVQTSQAGTSFACKCGRSVNVPSMRGLRDLPVAADQPPAPRGSAAKGGWGQRQAAAFALLLAGVAAVAYACYLYATKPENPARLAERINATEQARLDEIAQNMTTEQTFGTWNDLKAKGIAVDAPIPAELVRVREQYRAFRFRLILALSVGGIMFLGSAVCWYWPDAGCRDKIG